jgi:hypothetical protein
MFDRRRCARLRVDGGRRDRRGAAVRDPGRLAHAAETADAASDVQDADGGPRANGGRVDSGGASHSSRPNRSRFATRRRTGTSQGPARRDRTSNRFGR